MQTLRRLSGTVPPPSVAAWAEVVRALPLRTSVAAEEQEPEGSLRRPPRPPPSQGEAAWDVYPRCEEVDASALSAAAFERKYVRTSRAALITGLDTAASTAEWCVGCFPPSRTILARAPT